MLEKIKTSLRITHTRLDTDIQSNIDACLEDMRRCGIDTSEQTALIQKACELYVKAMYDFGDKGKQFQRNYETLRDSMSLSADYRKEDGGN